MSVQPAGTRPKKEDELLVTLKRAVITLPGPLDGRGTLATQIGPSGNTSSPLEPKDIFLPPGTGTYARTCASLICVAGGGVALLFLPTVEINSLGGPFRPLARSILPSILFHHISHHIKRIYGGRTDGRFVNDSRPPFIGGPEMFSHSDRKSVPLRSAAGYCINAERVSLQ